MAYSVEKLGAHESDLEFGSISVGIKGLATMTKLTEKQQAFVSNKAAGVANRDDAIAAGYAVAGAAVAADKLMRNPAVRTAIKVASKAHSVDIAADKLTMPRKHYADPLTFLQDVMNHGQLPIGMRADAAKQLLPYQPRA